MLYSKGTEQNHKIALISRLLGIFNTQLVCNISYSGHMIYGGYDIISHSIWNDHKLLVFIGILEE